MAYGDFPAMVSPWVENGTLTDYLDRCNNDLTAQLRFCIVSVSNPLVSVFECWNYRSTTLRWDYSTVSDFSTRWLSSR